MPTKQKFMADPVELKPFMAGEQPTVKGKMKKKKDLLQVIIETPKGSRNKYSFDVKQKIFKLKAALPAGMSFPYDFGFVPQTKAGDGDAIDVLVLMDAPAFPGCALLARLIGVMEGQQIDGKKKIRNDRLIAVADQNTSYTDIRKIGDLPDHFMRELQEFFVNYHKLQGHKFELLGCKDSKTARKLIQKARRAA